MVTDDRSGGNLSLCLTFPETQQQVRVVGTQEHPEFVARDVCEILELSNVTEALRSLDPDERGSVILNTPGGPQEMLTVTEPGLYRLVSVSRKPAARVFQRWVFHDVLPSLRLHGCYPPAPVPRNPNAIMLRQLANTLERQDRLEAEQGELTDRLERVEGHPNVAGRLRRLRRCPVVQDGDFGELTVTFDVADFAKVAKIMRPRRRRQVSQRERDRLRAVGFKKAQEPHVDVEQSGRPCVSRGQADSEHLPRQLALFGPQAAHK